MGAEITRTKEQLVGGLAILLCFVIVALVIMARLWVDLDERVSKLEAAERVRKNGTDWKVRDWTKGPENDHG